jgi:hypothetical protein
MNAKGLAERVGKLTVDFESQKAKVAQVKASLIGVYSEGGDASSLLTTLAKETAALDGMLAALTGLDLAFFAADKLEYDAETARLQRAFERGIAALETDLDQAFKDSVKPLIRKAGIDLDEVTDEACQKIKDDAWTALRGVMTAAVRVLPVPKAPAARSLT